MTNQRLLSIALLLALAGCAVERESGLTAIVPSYSYVQAQQPLRERSSTLTRADRLPLLPISGFE